MDTPFTPLAPTILVAATAVQIDSGFGPKTWRVRNLAASVQYFTHGASAAVTSIQPAAGVPAPNTIGMLPSSVETFGSLLPFMIASSATGFEVTQGNGI